MEFFFYIECECNYPDQILKVIFVIKELGILDILETYLKHFYPLKTFERQKFSIYNGFHCLLVCYLTAFFSTFLVYCWISLHITTSVDQSDKPANW